MFVFIGMKSVNLFFCFGAIAWFFAACGPHYAYEQQTTLPEAVWSYQDTVAFQFDIPDTTARYDLYATVAHEEAFGSQNVYLKILTRFPDGKQTSDVKSFDLYDLQGNCHGYCAGGNCRTQLLLKANTKFPMPGTYGIAFVQYTRRDSLTGIASMGLALEQR